MVFGDCSRRLRIRRTARENAPDLFEQEIILKASLGEALLDRSSDHVKFDSDFRILVDESPVKNNRPACESNCASYPEQF